MLHMTGSIALRARFLPAGCPVPGALLLTVALFRTGLPFFWCSLSAGASFCRPAYWRRYLVRSQHKQNPLSVLLMASCRFLVFAVTAADDGNPASVWFAGGVQFLYVVCISLVARHENSRQGLSVSLQSP